jgi:hypothetical protein
MHLYQSQGGARVIVELTTEQIEHIALRAAELRDGYVEHACNMALATPWIKLGDVTYEQVLRDIVANDSTYAEWMKLGANTGYRERTS